MAWAILSVTTRSVRELFHARTKAAMACAMSSVKWLLRTKESGRSGSDSKTRSSLLETKTISVLEPPSRRARPKVMPSTPGISMSRSTRSKVTSSSRRARGSTPLKTSMSACAPWRASSRSAAPEMDEAAKGSSSQTAM